MGAACPVMRFALRFTFGVEIREGEPMRIVTAFAAVLWAAGCAPPAINEMQISRNVWMLESSVAATRSSVPAHTLGDGISSLGGSIAYAIAAQRQESQGKHMVKRAAELTLQNGYTHFVIVNPQSHVDSRTFSTGPIYADTTFRDGGFGNIYANTTLSGGGVTTTNTSHRSLAVVMFNETDPQAVNALDAQQVLDRLNTK